MLAAERLRADLIDLPQGWFHHGPQVLRLLEAHRPRVVVELGSWLGASAIAMARSVRRWGGTVTCVDAWTGDLNEDGGSVSGPPIMLVSCARAMVEAGVGDCVRLIPASTVDAARRWYGPIDCLYVDADHSEAGVLADLRAWFPHVAPGGLLIGDDYAHPRYPGVARAWNSFAQMADLALTTYQSDPPVRGGVQLVSAVKRTCEMSENANDKKPMVSVRALQPHTTGGVAYDVDAVYDIPADLVDTVVAQGKAVLASTPVAAPHAPPPEPVPAPPPPKK